MHSYLPIDHRYVVYRWLTSDGFLLPTVVPGATVIEASVADRLEHIVSQIPKDAVSFHFHINCTVTRRFPACRDELVEHLASKGIRVINGDLTDISKRTIQRCCAELGLNSTSAARNGDPDELIIVKTDLNFGGDSEWALSSEDRASLGVGEGSQLIYKPDHYQVLPRRDIEDSWWTDPSLACERFIGNEEGRWYRAVLMFSKLVLRELVNPAQVKKVGQSIVTGQWSIDASEIAADSSPGGYPLKLVSDVCRFANGFSIDFGAIDIVIDDGGEPYIIDVNSTPAMHTSQPALIEYLRGALSTSSP